DRNEEIQLIKNLDLGPYTLDNFITTRSDSVIIVTYNVTTEETIGGERLPKRSSMRMSIFLKTNDGWKWLAHANLNPLKDIRGGNTMNNEKSKAYSVNKLSTLQKQLEESEQRYKTLTLALEEAIRDGIVINSLDGMTIDANQAYLDMLGYTLEEIKQVTYQQLTPQKWHKMEQDLFNLVMKRGYSGIYKKEYIRKDGTIFPVRVQAWLIRDEQGEPHRLLGIVRDLSEK
ncbi:MEKHLA domain-containing protein, partial [Candidatus Aerophobetes bacterium]|nr:MEKHLA domain-containing protein [Candidatus Aerophobetes bacterium]